jgi:hypothetical protein
MSDIHSEQSICTGYCPLDEQDELAIRHLESIGAKTWADNERNNMVERRKQCMGAVVVRPGLEECGIEHGDPIIDNVIPEQRIAEGISPAVADLIRQGRFTEAEMLQESEQ